MRRKRLALLLLAAAMLVLLAGCAQGNQTDFTAEQLEVWIWDESERETWQTIAASWTERTHIAVEITVKDEESYWEDVSSGLLPDLLWVDGGHLQDCIQSGLLLALDDRLEGASVQIENDYEPLRTLYQSGGSTWAVPKDSRVTALWYSRSIFDSRQMDYPDETWTWQDVYEAAQELTDRASGLYGFALNQTDTANGWYNLVYSAGGAILRTDESGVSAAAWDDGQTLAAMDLLAGLIADTMPSQPTMAQQGTMELFTSGHAAMVLLDSDQALELLSQGGSSQWACTVLPYWDQDGSGDCGEGERAAVLDGTGWAISGRCEDPNAAFDLLEAFAGQTGQEAQVSAGIALPAVSGLQETWEETIWTGALAPYRTMLESALLVQTPRQAAGQTWEDYAMETTLYTAWNNPDTMGEMLAEQQSYTASELSGASAPADAAAQDAGTDEDTSQSTQTDGDPAQSAESSAPEDGTDSTENGEDTP